jgi:2-oxoisovalerate dehydrogenase E1 component alpha subunit
LKAHLIRIGAWSEDDHTALVDEIDETVRAAAEEAESFGTLHSGTPPSPATMFEDVYAETPSHLLRQRQKAGF